MAQFPDDIYGKISLEHGDEDKMQLSITKSSSRSYYLYSHSFSETDQ